MRRRRECSACGERFTTYERVDEVPLAIRKRSGSLEPFDRTKLQAGIERAASGRLDGSVVDAIAAEVEAGVQGLGAVVASEQLGLAVLERLRDLDAVAYLRFASVYKGFEDLSDFAREVTDLQKTTAPKRRV